MKIMFGFVLGLLYARAANITDIPCNGAVCQAKANVNDMLQYSKKLPMGITATNPVHNATCKQSDTVCISPVVALPTVVSIRGTVNNNTYRFEFTSEDKKAYTYVQLGSEVPTCPMNCTDPAVIIATTLTLASTNVTLPFPAMNLTVNLQDKTIEETAGGVQAFESDGSCAATKLCAGLVPETKMNITIEGSTIPAATKIEFTDSGSAANKIFTYFSVNGMGTCPLGVTCTTPAYVARTTAGAITETMVLLGSAVTGTLTSRLLQNGAEGDVANGVTIIDAGDPCPANAFCATLDAAARLEVTVQGVVPLTAVKVTWKGNEVTYFKHASATADPTCGGGEDCTAPVFVDVSAVGAVASTPVTVDAAIAAPLEGTLRALADAEVANGIDVLAADGSCPSNKACTTLDKASKMDVQIEGTTSAMAQRLEFLNGGTVNSNTFFSALANETCPAGQECTTPPYIVLAGTAVAKTTVKLKVLASGVFGRKLYAPKITSAAVTEKPNIGDACDANMACVTVFERYSNDFYLMGKITRLPLDFVATLQDASTMTFKLYSSAEALKGGMLLFALLLAAAGTF